MRRFRSRHPERNDISPSLFIRDDQILFAATRFFHQKLGLRSSKRVKTVMDCDRLGLIVGIVRWPTSTKRPCMSPSAGRDAERN